MQETEVVERLVENEQRSKSNSKRLDSIESWKHIWFNAKCARNSNRNEGNERRPKQNEWTPKNNWRKTSKRIWRN